MRHPELSANDNPHAPLANVIRFEELQARQFLARRAGKAKVEKAVRERRRRTLADPSPMTPMSYAAGPTFVLLDGLQARVDSGLLFLPAKLAVSLLNLE